MNKDEAIQLLGEVPDRVIAEAVGVSIRAVGQWRAARGIPAWLPEKEWTQMELRLLGTAPDADIARKLRRSVKAVKRKRQKLGISTPDRTVDVEALKKIAEQARVDFPLVRSDRPGSVSDEDIDEFLDGG